MKNKVRVGLIIVGVVIVLNISLVFSMGNRVEKDKAESVVQKEEILGLKAEKVVGEKNKDNVITQTGEEGKVQYEEYVPEVLIEGKWGKGPGEFEKICHWSLSGDEKTYQPESIVIDSKGNVYILDVVNNRIQKFNKKGKYIKSIEVDSYDGKVVGYHLKYKFENEISTAIVGINWEKDFKDFSIISAVEIKRPDKVLGINMVIDSKDNLYYYCIRGEKGEVWLFKDDKLVRKWDVAKNYRLNIDSVGNIKVGKHVIKKNIFFKGEMKKRQIARKNFLISTKKMEKTKIEAKLENISTGKVKNFEFIPSRKLIKKEEFTIGKPRITNKYVMLHINIVRIIEDFPRLGETIESKMYIYDKGGNLISIVEGEIPSDVYDDDGNFYEMSENERGLRISKYMRKKK